MTPDEFSLLVSLCPFSFQRRHTGSGLQPNRKVYPWSSTVKTVRCATPWQVAFQDSGHLDWAVHGPCRQGQGGSAVSTAQCGICSPEVAAEYLIYAQYNRGAKPFLQIPERDPVLECSGRCCPVAAGFTKEGSGLRRNK